MIRLRNMAHLVRTPCLTNPFTRIAHCVGSVIRAFTRNDTNKLDDQQIKTGEIILENFVSLSFKGDTKLRIGQQQLSVSPSAELYITTEISAFVNKPLVIFSLISKMSNSAECIQAPNSVDQSKLSVI